MVSDRDVVAIGPRSGLVYRQIRTEWAERLEQLELTVFADTSADTLAHAAEFVAMAGDFPEGCFAGFDGDDLVAMGVGVRTDIDLERPLHRLVDIQRPGRGSGHAPDGRWYYGTTIAVRASHRGRGVGDELYQLRKGVCRTLDLDGIVAGGVIPGFARHKNEMGIDEYLDAVRRGRLNDPTLTFQLRQGFEVVCALPDYVENPKVDNYAALIVWRNPDRQES